MKDLIFIICVCSFLLGNTIAFYDFKSFHIIFFLISCFLIYLFLYVKESFQFIKKSPLIYFFNLILILSFFSFAYFNFEFREKALISKIPYAKSCLIKDPLLFPVNQKQSLIKENLEICGLIIESKVNAYKISSVLKSQKYGKLIFYNKDLSQKFFIGDEICLEGNIYEFKEQKTKNIYIEIKKFKIISIKIGESFEAKFLRNIERIKQKFLKIHEFALPENTKGFIEKLLLGSESNEELPFEIYKASKNLGLFHIFSLSGFHLSLIAIFIYALLSLFKTPLIIRNFLVIFFITIYCFLGGWSAPVFRSWFAAMFVLSAAMLNQKVKFVNIIFLSALIQCILDPFCIGDFGFQFSYLATLGLVLYNEKITEKLSFLPYSLANLISIPFSAQILIFPLQIFYFEQIPLYFILSNLSAIFFIPTILILSLIASLISMFSVVGWFIAAVIEVLIFILTQLFYGTIYFLNNLPSSALHFESPKFIWIIFSYLCVFLFIYCRKKAVSIHIIIAITLCIFIFQAQKQETRLSFEALSGKEYEAVFFNKSTESILICNQKGESNLKYPNEMLADNLEARGITAIKTLIGNCILDTRFTVEKQINLKNISKKEELIIENIHLEYNKHYVLLTYKNFNIFILFDGFLRLKEPIEKFSFVKLALPSAKFKDNFWNFFPKGEFCYLPKLSKKDESPIRKLIGDRCTKILNNNEFQNLRLETDGEFIYSLASINKN